MNHCIDCGKTVDTGWSKQAGRVDNQKLCLICMVARLFAQWTPQQWKGAAREH